MGEKSQKHSSKSKRSHEHDSERKSRKRHKDGHISKRHKVEVNVVDDNPDDEDMWVEKNIDMDGEHLLATDIPTAESLKLTSSAAPDSSQKDAPSVATAASMKRDEWMLWPTSVPAGTIVKSQPYDQLHHYEDSLTEDYGEPSEGLRTLSGGVDFFATLGKDIGKKANNKPDPDKPPISSKELNTEIRDGKSAGHDTATTTPAKPITPGGPGSQWRMMRLRRVYETAEEEGLPVEQVAVERFGSLDAFEEVKAERVILGDREGRRSDRGRELDRKGKKKEFEGDKRLMFTDIGGSGGSSRSSSFRRPGNQARTAPSTPSPAEGMRNPVNMRVDSLRLPSQAASPLSQSHTPIPSVMTPQLPGGSRTRALSPSSLNRLQAKALRAKLSGDSNADSLQKEFEEESKKSNGIVEDGVRTKVEVLPTLDARGRLYDVGHGKEDDLMLPGNRRKKEKVETRDPKTGDIVRYNADDDTNTLGEMLRQEKFGAGMADQKDLDAQFASAIMGDSKFQNDLDYIDDNAEKLGRRKMRSDGMKRQFAIHDYKRTQKAMASCSFCFGEDDSLPKAPLIALGTRVYLSCTVNEELVDGHCLIVPIQHHLNMLEGDDDVWDEVRNFMKCLMHMFADEDKGVIFYETVISLKWQKHTVIECVPLPWEQFEVIPGYFKESILQSEAEWSQHKKLIDFSARPGGFRRAMVPNLPYFMVQFDHKGEKGYGHVVEGTGEGAGASEEDGGLGEGEKGGGEFPSYFAGEIIGNVLETEPRRWRRPRRIDFRHNRDRVSRFKTKYDKFDWTIMIGRQA